MTRKEEEKLYVHENLDWLCFSKPVLKKVFLLLYNGFQDFKTTFESKWMTIREKPFFSREKS